MVKGDVTKGKMTNELSIILYFQPVRDSNILLSSLNFIERSQRTAFINKVKIIWPSKWGICSRSVKEFTIWTIGLKSDNSDCSKRIKGSNQKVSWKRIREKMVTYCGLLLCPVTKSYLTLCHHMNCSMPGFLILHYLPEFAQTQVHGVGDAIQLSYPLLPPFPSFCLSQHQGLFQWISSSHRVAKVLEFQLQHQSFQETPRTDLL